MSDATPGIFRIFRDAESHCPYKDSHTQMPEGYVARAEWAAEMGRTQKSAKCPGCGLWALWFPVKEGEVHWWEERESPQELSGVLHFTGRHEGPPYRWRVEGIHEDCNDNGVRYLTFDRIVDADTGEEIPASAPEPDPCWESYEYEINEHLKDLEQAW